MKPDAWHDPLFLAALAANGKGGTASGSIVTFRAYGNPLRSLRLDIDPVQDLHGYSNPWPAGGGKNKFGGADGTYAIGTTRQLIVTNGVFTYKVVVAAQSLICFSHATIAQLMPNPTLKAGTYTFRMTLSAVTTSVLNSMTLNLSDGTSVVNGGTFMLANDADIDSITSSIDAYYDIGTYACQVQIESGSSVTSWQPYSNVCPISGWSEVNLWRTGKNLFNPTGVTYKKWNLDSNAFKTVADSSSIVTVSATADDITITTLSGYYGVGVELDACPYDRVASYPSLIGGAIQFWSAYEEGATRISTGASSCIIPANTAGFLAFRVDSAKTVTTKVQVEVGTTITDWTPYTGTTYPITIPTPPGTVYGGTLNVTTGVLTVDRALKTFTGQESGWEKFSNNNPNGTYFGLAGTTSYAAFADDPEAICSINKRSSAAALLTGDGFYWTSSGWRILYGATGGAESLDDFKTYLQQMYAAETPVTVCAKLASPITYSLSGITVQTLDGQNVMWGDSGDISVEWGRDKRINKEAILASIIGQEN